MGEERDEPARITVMNYDDGRLDDIEVHSVAECARFKDAPGVMWINLDGIQDVETIEQLGRLFGIHSLILEDTLHTGQRPKAEAFDDYCYIVLRLLSYDESEDEIKAQQVSLILGRSFVISLAEAEGGFFDPVRERIISREGRIRQAGADYLAYALIDAVVDHYFVILEELGDRIQSLEDDVLDEPTARMPREVRRLRRSMIALHRAIWPLSEVLARLQRGESPLIEPETLPYLRDVADHTNRALDTIETSRELLSSMLECYLSIVNNRMNQVVKLLTIVATIFIPLSFITSIYGMNFEYVPEHHWRWGYFAVWGVMIMVAASLVCYFRKKKWL